MAQLKHFLSGLGAIALAGCGTLEPKFQRPALPTPVEFPQSQGAPSAGTSPSVAALGWPEFITDPKLRRVIELGLANNRDLRVAVANIEAARAEYRVERSYFFPSVQASANGSSGRQLTGGANASSGVSSVSTRQYSVELGISSYELDLFGRVRSLSKAALEEYLATEEARRVSQISLVAEISNAYLTLAADKALLGIAQDTLNSSQASMDLARKRFHGGVASELDVRQAETLVQQARADVALDTTTVAQDRNALDLLVGAPIPANLLPEALDDRVPVLGDIAEGAPSDLLTARPDIIEAEHLLKARNANIAAARAAFFPSISLTGSGGTSSTALSGLFKGGSNTWNFSPQISLPIFDGGANQANLGYAKAERSVYLARYEKAIQTAFKEVADALARRATITEQLDANQDLVDSAAAALRLSQARYERGIDTFLTVLDAQRTLYSAQQSLAQARLVRSTNLVAVYRALGGGAL